MAIVQSYNETINAFVAMTGASHEMMHIHIGLALYLGMQIILRTRRASPFALGIVITAELVHESLQMLYYGEWRTTDTLGDIALTIFWPAAITLVGLYRRKRWDSMQKARRVCKTLLATDYAARISTHNA